VTQRSDVLVIGAGVMGLTAAVRLAESGLSVRVRTAEPPAETTSAVAGAIVVGPVPADPLEAQWFQETRSAFANLTSVPDAGVRVQRGRIASRDGDGTPEWATEAPGYEPCAPEEYAGFPVAFWATAPVIDMPRYLEYLSGRLIAAGGELEVKSVGSLEEAVAEAGHVVNCTGLGARELVGDQEMRPVRGQHVVVENPGLDEFLYDRTAGATLTSYLPHSHRLVLGGTVERGVGGLDPDPAVTEAILARCIAIEPRIEGARILSVDVGLRPARPRVRLAEEQVGGGHVVHNYGHGGQGVSLSWGCAHEVERLVRA